MLLVGWMLVLGDWVDEIVFDWEVLFSVMCKVLVICLGVSC